MRKENPGAPGKKPAADTEREGGKVRRRSQKPDDITEKTSEPPESRAGHTVLKEPPCARVGAQTWATKSPEKDPVRKRGRNSLSLKDTREIREREPPNSNTY